MRIWIFWLIKTLKCRIKYRCWFCPPKSINHKPDCPGWKINTSELKGEIMVCKAESIAVYSDGSTEPPLESEK